MCDAPACPPAFFVIGFSDFTGVSQLGALTGIAMLLNVAATFLVLPALIFYAGSRALPVSTVSATEPLAGYARAAEWLAARPRLLLYGVAALLGVSAAGLTQVRLDTDLSHLRPGGGEAERVERRIEQEFGRAQASGMVLTRGDSLDEALATAERVAERLTEVK
ncbi:MAG: MMPL family transporter, partial [Candidatus Binatia bacterium]